MRQTVAIFFGAKFVVKYWHAKHENRKCCPQHGALSAMSAGLAFSAVTIAVSEPFLLIDLFHMVIFNFGGFVFVSYRGGPYY